MARVQIDTKIGLYDMLSGEFRGEDLPDDFICDIIDLQHKNDLFIKVLGDTPVHVGREYSRLCFFDPDDCSIHVGVKEMDELPYTIMEDKRGCDAILKYCMKNDFHYETGMFPDVPVAETGIPSNQYYRPNCGYDFEESIAKKNFIILNPSLGCFHALSKYYGFASTEKRDNMSLINKEDRYFCFQDSEIFKDFKEYNIVTLQFNPFHPMAIHTLGDCKWEGTIFSGYYKYRGNYIPFEFDLNDKRYRVHSDVWRWSFDCSISNGWNEVFDMVSYVDFADFFKFIDKGFVEPLIIEPILVYGRDVTPFPYSDIGPFSDSIERGQGMTLRTPYTRCTIENEFGMETYYEVTKHSEYYSETNMICFNDIMYNVVNKKIDCPYLFLKMVFRDGYVSHRLFSKKKFKKKDKAFKFIYCKDIFFSSFPMNNSGSIIYSYQCISVLDLIRGESFFHEFLPMYIQSPMLPEIEYHYLPTNMGPEEKIIVDPSELSKFHLNIFKEKEDSSVFCALCGAFLPASDMVSIKQEANIYFHKRCVRCVCQNDNKEKIYYHKFDRKFYCNNRYTCSHQRVCCICDKDGDTVKMDFGEEYRYYHRKCVRCDCGKKASYHYNTLLFCEGCVKFKVKIKGSRKRGPPRKIIIV